MNFLRTPDAAFDDLPDYYYAPHYLRLGGEYGAMRLHYVDEGESGARVFLCLHGNPTWSYLYRKMIPVFVESNARVIAPDMFGFGRSDKPVEEAAHTFDFHRNSLLALIEKLDLRNITLVCQDWGGLFGLTLPPAMPDRFANLIVMNTTLATGDKPFSEGFLKWREFSNNQADLNIAALLERAGPNVTKAESAGYERPFPDKSYKAAIRRFPNLVPAAPDAEGALISRNARDWWRQSWTGKSFMAIGALDPVFNQNVMLHLQQQIRNCPSPLVLPNEGHFVPESGATVARAALTAL